MGARKLPGYLLLIAISFWSSCLLAGDTYLGGRVVNVTSYAGGLLVILDTGVRTNCAGVGYNWMTIAESKLKSR